ncbi:MAG: DUF3108 domain-containing protein [Gammaproteobacteria bacterium]|nr:DUF3108 domain-containing protein [Gammaproteobacteria bacterium]
MKLVLSLTLCISMLSFPCHALAAPIKPLIGDEFVATYTASKHGLGVATVRWQVAALGGRRFSIESVTQTKGLARLVRRSTTLESSQWHLTDTQRVQPASYRYVRDDKPARNTTIRFEWPQSVAVSDVAGQENRLAVPPDATDRLTLILALMADLSTSRMRDEYQIAGRRSVKRVRVTAAETVEIDTAIGPLGTQVVVQERLTAQGTPTGRVTRYWCAPTLGFLPVRVERIDGDEKLTLAIEAFARGPDTATR